MESRLLEILVCPVCKGPLQHDREHNELSQAEKLAYTPRRHPRSCCRRSPPAVCRRLKPMSLSRSSPREGSTLLPDNHWCETLRQAEIVRTAERAGAPGTQRVIVATDNETYCGPRRHGI